MSKLQEIGIKVVSDPQDAGQSGIVVTILHELSEMLNDLLEKDESSAFHCAPPTRPERPPWRAKVATCSVVTT